MAAGAVEYFDSAAHGVIAAADPIVEFLRRALQVDIGGVDKRRELLDDSGGRASVRNKDVAERAADRKILL